MEDKGLRIGEVARRTGVAVDTLRAWERRYDVLAPHRTPGGHRLYGESDIARVRAMSRLIDDGWAVGSAAREVLHAPTPALPADAGPVERLREQLHSACESFDAPAMHLALDDVFARFEVVAALDEVVLPVVRHIGDGWDTDPHAIAREHFASNLVRPRLLRLLQTGGPDGRRVCVAAAPEHEEHDLGLLAAAVTATGAGWSVRYLGARCPTAAMLDAVAATRPQCLMVGAVRREAATAFVADTRDTELPVPVVLGGAGFRHGDIAGRPRWHHHADGMGPLGSALAEAVRSPT